MALKHLHEMVGEAALEHSDRKAVVWDNSESPGTSLSYHQLMTLGNDLCTHLQRTPDTVPDVVGVYCEVNLLLPAWIVGSVNLASLITRITFDGLKENKKLFGMLKAIKCS